MTQEDALDPPSKAAGRPSRIPNSGNRLLIRRLAHTAVGTWGYRFHLCVGTLWVVRSLDHAGVSGIHNSGSFVANCAQGTSILGCISGQAPHCSKPRVCIQVVVVLIAAGYSYAHNQSFSKQSRGWVAARVPFQSGDHPT